MQNGGVIFVSQFDISLHPLKSTMSAKKEPFQKENNSLPTPYFFANMFVFEGVNTSSLAIAPQTWPLQLNGFF